MPCMSCMLYMVTFTINIPPMLAYIAYMDPMGIHTYIIFVSNLFVSKYRPSMLFRGVTWPLRDTKGWYFFWDHPSVRPHPQRR